MTFTFKTILALNSVKMTTTSNTTVSIKKNQNMVPDKTSLVTMDFSTKTCALVKSTLKTRMGSEAYVQREQQLINN